MATYSPDALNEPESFTFTADGNALVQVKIDGTNLVGADVLNVQIAIDSTGDNIVYAYTDMGENETEQGWYTPHFIVMDGKTLTLTLEQTAGTVRTIDYSIDYLMDT